MLCHAAIADEALDTWIARLQKPLDRVNLAIARHEDVDYAQLVNWRDLGSEVLRLGAENPTLDDLRLRNLAGVLLRRTSRYVPNLGVTLRQEMQQSPNRALRLIGNAQSELTELERQPLDMRFTAVDGREVDMQKMRGKVVLVDFWAAKWCGACKVQKPLLKEIYAKYQDQGFEVIGIACEMRPDDRQFLIEYVREHKVPWPQFFDGRGMHNPYTERFGFIGVPQYLLVDQQGLLIAHTSGSNGLSNLEAVVRRQLGLPPLQPGDIEAVLGVR